MQSTVPTAEIWKPVVGYEGSYEVSSFARVRSLDRTVLASNGTRRYHKGQILRQKMGEHYLAVGLSKNGETLRWNIHHLVCEAFHGKRRPEARVVRHLNGNALDNRPENLRWGTPAENSADMVAHGRSRASETHCKSGHEFTDENTYRNRRGVRICRTCKRAARAREHERRRLLRLERREERPCRVCRKSFVGFPSAAYCSPECKKASRRVSFKNLRQEANDDRRMAA